MIINISLLFSKKISSLEALRTHTAKRMYFYIKLDGAEKFVRVTEETYWSLHTFYNASCMSTKTQGENVKHFTCFQIKAGVFN